MAGTIAVTPDRRWSAATWLFDWTVEFLAANVREPDVKASLEEIVTENLGWLELSDYRREVNVELRELLRTRAVAAADETFARTMPDRDGAIDLLRRLAEAV